MTLHVLRQHILFSLSVLSFEEKTGNGFEVLYEIQSSSHRLLEVRISPSCHGLLKVDYLDLFRGRSGSSVLEGISGKKKLLLFFFLFALEL